MRVSGFATGRQGFRTAPNNSFKPTTASWRRLNSDVRPLMSARYSIKCSDCEFSFEISCPPKTYSFPDETVIALDDGFGWCKSCATVTQCGNLPSLVDVERFLHQIEGNVSADLLNETRRVRDWLLSRTSPPRCLTCSGTDVKLFPSCWSVYRDDDPERDFLDIAHPRCGGSLRVDPVGMSLFRCHAARYSSEGLPLVA